MLTLASASETRAKMLRDVGLDIETVPSGVDEDEIKNRYRRDKQPADELALALAEAKALAIDRSDLILGADQILSFNGETFDKPQDFEEAKAQLKQLRGMQHELLSAAVIVENGSVIWRHIGRATLTMRNFSDVFLESYIQEEGETVLTTVGGYRIEARGAQLFDAISGDYFSILGLPLLDVLEFLRRREVLIE